MGFETAAVISGELQHPGRDLAVGMLGGVVGTGLLYLLLLFVCLATVPDLANARRPLADAAGALIGPAGAIAIAAAATLSTGANLTGWMIASPRVLYALGAQGDLPAVFAKVDPVRRTPAVAIVTSASLVWLLTVSGTFVYLATFAALSRLLTYASTSAALIVLRKREGPAPIVVPYGPLWSVLALLCTTAALATTTGTAVRDVSIALALGWVIRMAGRLRRA
jgi:amino acid transporter